MSRIDKVNSQIKKEITYIIQRELDDPNIGFVSIVKVETARDLSVSKVFYSIFGAERHKVEETLLSMNKFIRRSLAERIRLKYLPEIKFIFDDSIEYSVNIYKKIEDLKNASGKNSQGNQG